MCNSKVKLFVKSNDIHKGRVYVIDLSNNPNFIFRYRMIILSMLKKIMR